MLAMDDDDIPLAVVKAKVGKAAGSSTEQTHSASESQASKNLKQQNSSKDSSIKIKGVKESATAKDTKKTSKDPKKTIVSSEWADFDKRSSISTKKSKSLTDWARSNTYALLFTGLVIFLVACRFVPRPLAAPATHMTSLSPASRRSLHPTSGTVPRIR